MTRVLRWTNPRLVLAGAFLSLAVAVSAVYGCAGSQPSEEAPMAEAEPQGITIPDVPVPLAVPLNHVMVAQVDHASHALWDAARDCGMPPGKGRCVLVACGCGLCCVGAPESDEDWRELQHHAIQVVSGGTLIVLGGTGQADAGYVQLVGWSDWAQDMTDAGAAALLAIENHDIIALLAAGDLLVESCEGCHREFKPDLPSEGYMHPHYIGPSDEG